MLLLISSEKQSCHDVVVLISSKKQSCHDVVVLVVVEKAELRSMKKQSCR